MSGLWWYAAGLIVFGVYLLWWARRPKPPAKLTKRDLERYQ
jgi:hypothetical protein